MPIPLLVMGGVLIATTVAGAGAGAAGAHGMAKAKRLVDDRKADYEAAYEGYCNREARATDAVVGYDDFCRRVQTSTLAEWVAWLEAHEKLVRQLPHQTADGITIELPDLPQLQRLVNPGGLAVGGATAAVAAVAAQQAALAAVRSFAVAGTGAAIGGLSGAAAESAALAWLGGGTLAAGGGGVAAGSMVLTGVAIAPAALLGGITLAVAGDKALTQAQQYASEVVVAMENIDTAIAMFDQLDKRIAERIDVIKRTADLARTSLAALSAHDFDPADREHVEVFQRTALLMRAVREHLQTPLVETADTDKEAS